MGIMDKIKDTANKAAEGVQKAAESGQDMYEESKLKKRIGELKEELGGVVFAQRTGAAAPDADAQVDRLVGEISAAEAELAEKRADGSPTDAPPTAD